MQQSYESMVRRVKSKDSDIEILTNKITHLETKYPFFYLDAQT